MYSIQCTVYNVQYTMYSIQCTDSISSITYNDVGQWAHWVCAKLDNFLHDRPCAQCARCPPDVVCRLERKTCYLVKYNDNEYKTIYTTVRCTEQSTVVYCTFVQCTVKYNYIKYNTL